jgi:hypothetical protein
MTILTACSYKLGVRDRRFPGGYEFVSVPVFKNITQETGAEVYFTNGLIEELERSRLVTITSKDNAQVVLEGTITSISYDESNQTANSSSTPAPNLPGTYNPGAFLPSNTTLSTEYYITIKVLLAARRTSDQKVIWKSKFESRRPYEAPQLGVVSVNASDATYNSSAHYLNIQDMAVDMMSEAHDRLTENF